MLPPPLVNTPLIKAKIWNPDYNVLKDPLFKDQTSVFFTKKTQIWEKNYFFLTKQALNTPPPLNKDILYLKSSVKISEDWKKMNFERETHILDFTTQ